MQTSPNVFLHLSATGWTAIGSIVGALSIIALTVFNILTLKAARRATKAAEAQSVAAQNSLGILQNQLSLTQRPFIAVHAEFCEEINAVLVYAHNQGNGPALDVEALLIYEGDQSRLNSYLIGCLAVDGKFQFKIGAKSKKLSAATIWYKSIAGENWTTEVQLLGGHPWVTNVTKGHLEDEEHSQFKTMFPEFISPKSGHAEE